MDNFYFIGVDVSKKKLDFCVLFEGKVLREEQVSNHQQAVARLIGELKNDLEMDNEQFLICAEHTGQYTFPLVCACKSVECKLWLENPSQIKYSSGMQRGKNDKVDAKRIAIYASRFGDKVKYYDRPTEEIERLKQLERERALYVTDLAKYKGQMYDQKDFMPAALYRKKTKRMKGLIQELQAAIDAITAEMEKIIGSTEVLARQMELLMSIDGVGKVVALNVIIETEAFSRFDNPRKFCCHAGVAPFSYTSGSSQHSKNKVSHRANKNIKKLLHMAAVSVTHRKEGELKAYYMRKVEEGKNKMSVINALRAKIVARMFAVIKKRPGRAGRTDGLRAHHLARRVRAVNASAATFEFEGERLTYTASRDVDYQNEDLAVGVYYNDGAGFTAGTYRVEVYADGRLAGQSDIVLR